MYDGGGADRADRAPGVDELLESDGDDARGAGEPRATLERQRSWPQASFQGPTSIPEGGDLWGFCKRQNKRGKTKIMKMPGHFLESKKEAWS